MCDWCHEHDQGYKDWLENEYEDWLTGGAESEEDFWSHEDEGDYERD